MKNKSIMNWLKSQQMKPEGSHTLQHFTGLKVKGITKRVALQLIYNVLNDADLVTAAFGKSKLNFTTMPDGEVDLLIARMKKLVAN